MLEVWALQQIQKNLDLTQKISILNQKEFNIYLLKIVQKKLNKSGIKKYGQEYLYIYFQTQKYNFS